MMLFTAGAMTILGGIDESQMQTTILERLTSTEEAFANSEIAITFNPVYIGLVRDPKGVCIPAVFIPY